MDCVRIDLLGLLSQPGYINSVKIPIQIAGMLELIIAVIASINTQQNKSRHWFCDKQI